MTFADIAGLFVSSFGFGWGVGYMYGRVIEIMRSLRY